MFYTIDSETYPITPGGLAPPMVCLQFAEDFDDPVIAVVGVDRVRDWLEHILQSELIVGQNTAYDMLVFGRQYPDLMPLIFKAYAEDRITDTIVREKLKRIADGSFWRLRGKGWSLGVLAKRYGGEKDSQDPWRVRYHELWGVPVTEWPPEAWQYAVHDIVATREVFLQQSDSKPESGSYSNCWRVSDDEFRQSRAAWVMHLTGATGVYTDRAAIEEFEERERLLYEEDKKTLQEAGLVRETGVRNLDAARGRMEQICEEKGARIPKTDKGYTSLDEDACNESGDDLLKAYQRYGSRKNLLTRIQALYKGVNQPINPRFDSLMETGRTSCSKGKPGGPTNGYQVQNMRRAQGERECFTSRDGRVFLASDYSTVELCTLAQCCLWAVGYSELARVLCEGLDPHLALGAETLGMTYEEALSIYKDLSHPRQAEVEEARQVCKVANFGYPGGMSSSTFRAYARGYGIELSEVQAATLQENWFARWVEMAAYFAWIKRSWPWVPGKRKQREVQVTTIRQFVSNRMRGNITYTVVCNGFFQGLAADLAKAAGFRLCMECETGELQGWKPWNFVHDEYILEGPEEDGDRAAQVVKRIMEEEGQKWVPDIPIVAEPALMRRWSKKAKTIYDAEGKMIPWEDVLKPISEFKGNYRFLSNFWHASIVFEGVTYPTTEHAYQAAKTLDMTKRQEIAQLSTPGEAKKAGRSVDLRDDWEDVKLGIMEVINEAKFQYPDLRDKLLATGDRQLVEGNTWGDRFWGVCDGEGENHLGHILMNIRKRLCDASGS